MSSSVELDVAGQVREYFKRVIVGKIHDFDDWLWKIAQACHCITSFREVSDRDLPTLGALELTIPLLDKVEFKLTPRVVEYEYVPVIDEKLATFKILVLCNELEVTVEAGVAKKTLVYVEKCREPEAVEWRIK